MKLFNKYLLKRSKLTGHLDYSSWKPQTKLKYLKFFPKDVKTVLDVGCGLGELLWILNEKGYDVEGCDIDKFCIEKSQKVGKVKYANVENLSKYYPNDSFDLIACLHVLEHVPRPYDALIQIKKVTKKYALLAVPNARYITFPERETHLFSWNIVTFKNFIKHCGFKIVLLSEEWTNIIPNVLRLAPLSSRIFLRILYDPFELIALCKKGS